MSTAQLAMQYLIDLPADYDMGIIRERVRTRGSALDDRKGLSAKAYCIREIGVDGSPVNQYAPFYLWDDSAAAAEFLWGGAGFGAIIGSFGRPAVRTWIPAAVAAGLVPGPAVTRAWLRTSPIPRGTDLDAAADRLAGRIRRREANPGVHVAIAGISPTTWESVEFITTGGAAPGPLPGGADTATFSVLHISQPGAPR
jgi:hypothetical protein